jgi:hypothetical protein
MLFKGIIFVYGDNRVKPTSTKYSLHWMVLVLILKPFECKVSGLPPDHQVLLTLTLVVCHIFLYSNLKTQTLILLKFKQHL